MAALQHYVLLFSCPDQSGIVASVVGRIYSLGGNINDSIQHHEREDDIFFMRVSWEMSEERMQALAPHGKVTNENSCALLEQQFQDCIEQFQLSYQIASLEHLPRLSIMVSKQQHCLYDLLLQWREGELPCIITSIISNHQEAEEVAQWFSLPFYYTPVKRENTESAEKEQLQLLQGQQVECIVLARYMRILSEDFVKQYSWKIINIHHSFLPAFVGSRPYHQAFNRGVKVIGATSHYVTSELDQGPIIAQDVTPVSHRDSVAEMIRKGKNLERTVLTRALRLHLERRILVYNNKTIIFA